MCEQEDVSQNPTQDAVLLELDALLQAAWRRYQDYMIPAQNDLSMHQVYFLMFLARQITCTPSDVAQEFGVTLGAVTGFVDRLYKLGLVSRVRSEEDRRLVLIQLTDKGIGKLKEFEKARTEKLVGLQETLGEAGIQRLNLALRQLVGGLASLDKE